LATFVIAEVSQFAVRAFWGDVGVVDEARVTVFSGEQVRASFGRVVGVPSDEQPAGFPPVGDGLLDRVAEAVADEAQGAAIVEPIGLRER
jgi:hypothetical protein